MRNKIIGLALFALAGCSSPSTETNNGAVPTCNEGETRNPVTGSCELPIVAGNDAGNANNGGGPVDTGGQLADQGQGEPDQGLTPVDTGLADSGQPPVDLGSKLDMAGPSVTRFVAIGDQGTGSDTQRLVGQSIGTVCTGLGGCDFGLLLGDNFYQSGVSSVDDAMWTTMFVEPYGHLPFPFWAVLGNHDLGGDGLGIDLDQDKANYQIDYSAMNPQWKMPARHYEFTEGPIWFVGLDTTDIFFDRADDQRANVPSWLPRAQGRWKIAFGHHPYLSNGPHGNAGEYEGYPFIPIANGEHVRDFMEDVVCGNFDFYLCGHDHSRQDIVETCNGTQFIVSGAGAKTTDLEGDNAAHFESDTEGFLVMEATMTTMKIQFYDANGLLEHERLVTR